MISGRSNLARVAAVLLALALPMCCCPARAVLASVAAATGRDAPGIPAHAGCCERGGPASPGDENPGNPCDDGPADGEDRGCTCGKSRAMPGEVPAIGHGVAIAPPDLGVARPAAAGSAAPAACPNPGAAADRGQWTLLALHCALTV